MPFISERMSETSEIQRFSAVKNHLFEITDVQIALTGTGNNILGLFDYYVEDDDHGAVMDFANSKPFVVLDTISQQSFYVHFTVPIKTKYISMGRFGGTGFNGHVIINYRFVKASMADLVWEFLKRGKNP